MALKLVLLDMDGVIFKGVNFWLELHKHYGTYEEGKKATDKYLHSDYKKLVEVVVKGMWKGKPAKQYFELIDSLEYIPGAKELFEYLHKNDYLIAIISASSIHAAKRVQEELRADFVFGNELVIKDDKLSGEFKAHTGSGLEEKPEIIKQVCKENNVSLEESCFIGDSKIDLKAMELVGLPIAFNPDKELREKALEKNWAIAENNLKNVIITLEEY